MDRNKKTLKKQQIHPDIVERKETYLINCGLTRYLFTLLLKFDNKTGSGCEQERQCLYALLIFFGCNVFRLCLLRQWLRGRETVFATGSRKVPSSNPGSPMESYC